jgi:hypothetical protein
VELLDSQTWPQVVGVAVQTAAAAVVAGGRTWAWVVGRSWVEVEVAFDGASWASSLVARQIQSWWGMVRREGVRGWPRVQGGVLQCCF